MMRNFGRWLVLSLVPLALLLAGCQPDEITNNYLGDGTAGGADEPPPTQFACTSDDPFRDADGDGLTNCEELDVFGTSPLIADTDGDGWSDFEEIVDFGFDPVGNNFQFNPLIADLPAIEVQLRSAPALAVLSEDSSGVESSYEVTRSSSSSQTVVSSRSSSRSQATEISSTTGESFSVGTEVEASVGLDPSVSSSVSTEYTTSYESSTSTATENTLAWTAEQAQENETGYEEAQAEATSAGRTLSGGTIAITADIRNSGEMAFSLQNLVISAVLAAPTGGASLKPVGNLGFDTGGQTNEFPVFTYGPGERKGPFVFLNDGLDLETTKALLLDSSGLVVRPAAYELVDDTGRSFNHNLTGVNAKTALVMIDYDGRAGLPHEAYNVAVKADPERLRLSAGEALSGVLGIPYAVDPATGRLHSVRSVAAEPLLHSHWLVTHQTDRGGRDRYVRTYGPRRHLDFEGLELKAGDALHLVYVYDPDGDGMGRRLERQYGTDPGDRDTDGDGVSDPDEVLRFAAFGYDFANPDSDGDGTRDGGDEVLWKAVAFSESFQQDNFAAAIENRTVWTWGSNRYGERGIGTVGNPPAWPTPIDDFHSSAPLEIQVSHVHRIVSVDAGRNHVLALTGQGAIEAWGRDHMGQLGLDTTTACDQPQPELCPEPALVGTDTDWVAIAADDDSSFAIKSDGSLWAWGSNINERLGIPVEQSAACQWFNTSDTVPCVTEPTRVGTASDWYAVSSKSSLVLALKTDGTLWSWGMDSRGLLGRDAAGEPCSESSDKICDITPGQIGNDDDWAFIDARGPMAIKENGTLWAWGPRTEIFARPAPDTCKDNEPCARSPIQVGADTDWAEVSSIYVPFSMLRAGVLARKRDNTLWNWGMPADAQYFPCCVFVSAIPVPTQVGTDADWYTAGYMKWGFDIDGTDNLRSVLALKRNGQGHVWGLDGGATPEPWPTQAELALFR